MLIRASYLVAITLMFLVGCSEKSTNESSSDSPSSSDTESITVKNLAQIQEMVQNVVNGVHERIQNGEIDLSRENNLNIQDINITTTGGGFPFGDMIYVENINTKDLITIRWIQSANGYELVGYSFPSHDVKFNCTGPCPIYYPQ